MTARNLSSVKNVLDINMFDYIILNNGAFILDARIDKITSFGVINKEDLDKIQNIINDTSVKFEYASLNGSPFRRSAFFLWVTFLTW